MSPFYQDHVERHCRFSLTARIWFFLAAVNECDGGREIKHLPGPGRHGQAAGTTIPPAETPAATALVETRRSQCRTSPCFAIGTVIGLEAQLERRRG